MDLLRGTIGQSTNPQPQQQQQQQSSPTSVGFTLKYLGSTPLMHAGTGFGSVVKPLRELYFRQVFSTDSHPQERAFVLEDNGLTIKYWDHRMKGFMHDHYPLSHVVYFDAARFEMIRTKKKTATHGMFRRFADSNTSADLSTEGNHINIEKKHRKYMCALPHAPLVVCVLRRPRGVSFLDAHVLMAESEMAALSFVHELAVRIMRNNEGDRNDTFTYEPYAGAAEQNRPPPAALAAAASAVVSSRRSASESTPQGSAVSSLEQRYLALSAANPSPTPPQLSRFSSQSDMLDRSQRCTTSATDDFLFENHHISSWQQQQQKLKAAKSMLDLSRQLDREAETAAAAAAVGRLLRRTSDRDGATTPPRRREHKQAAEKNTDINEQRHSVLQLISKFEVTAQSHQMETELQDNSTSPMTPPENTLNQWPQHQQFITHAPFNLPPHTQRPMTRPYEHPVARPVARVPPQVLQHGIQMRTDEATTPTVVHTLQRLHSDKSNKSSNKNKKGKSGAVPSQTSSQIMLARSPSEIKQKRKMDKHKVAVSVTKEAEIQRDMRHMKLHPRKKSDLESALGYLP